jgi:hypothetical protein
MTKIKKTFTLGEDAAQLLEELAEQFYADNQTETVRAGLRALAAQHGLGETTWIIDGYVSGHPSESGRCYRCERRFEAGALLYRPVFRRGAEAGTETFSQLPDREIWICAACVAE